MARWEIDEERLPASVRPTVAAVQRAEPSSAGTVSLLQMQRLLGNRAVVDAVQAGGIVDPSEPVLRSGRRPGGSPKHLGPTRGNPKIDRTAPNIAAKIAEEVRADDEEEARELRSAPPTSRKGKTRRELDKRADERGAKRKNPGNTNYRGGVSPSRAGYAIKAFVKDLPDVAVHRLPGGGPNGLAGIDPDDYGFCETEDIGDADIKVKAVRHGDEWVAELKKVSAKYSLLTQLPTGCDEITGPGGGGPGETTIENSKEQIRSLLATEGDNYYMEKSVLAHEECHEEKLLPALRNKAKELTDAFAQITVPYSGKGNPSTPTAKATEAEALQVMKAQPEYAQTVAAMRNVWDAEYVNLITGQHGGETQRAEILSSTPMILRINAFRVRKGKSPLRWKETWQPY